MKSLVAVAALLALTAGSATSHTSGVTCNGQIVKLFDNTNGNPVVNGAKPPLFTTKGAYCVTSIGTYHWNGGKGAPPGTLSLTRASVAAGFPREGPFPAKGSPGQNGAPNVNWQATVSTSPSPTVIDGTYACKDSSPSTWSANTAGGAGFCIVYGIPAQAQESTPPTTITTTAPTTTAVAPTTSPDCRCSSLVMTTASVQTTANDGSVPAEFKSMTRMNLYYKLTCTGGRGSCKGTISAIALAPRDRTQPVWHVWQLNLYGKKEPATKRSISVRCSAPCGRTKTILVQLVAVTTSSKGHIANTLPAFSFDAHCDTSTTNQFLFLGYDHATKLLGGARQMPTAPFGVAPPPPETPASRPCQCAALTLGDATDVHVSSASASDARAARVSLVVPWELHCTGGDGRCSGEIRVDPPPGATGVGWFEVKPDGTPGKEVGGLKESELGFRGDSEVEGDTLTVTCAGPCGTLTTGKFLLRFQTRQPLAGSTLGIKLHVICAHNDAIRTVALSFDRSGSLTGGPTHPLVPEPISGGTKTFPGGCVCDSVSLGSQGLATYGTAGGRSVLTARLNWTLDCSGGLQGGSCDGRVVLVPQEGVDAALYATTTSAGKVGEGLSIACEGDCGRPASGTFYLRAALSGPLAGRTVTFEVDGVCPEDSIRTARALLRLHFGKSGKLVGSELVPASR